MYKCVGIVLLGVLLISSPVKAVLADVGKVNFTQLAQVDEKVKKKAKKKKEKRECRRIRETGSRIASRVCKKPSQWAREEERAQESVRRSVEGAKRVTTTGDG